MANVYVRRANRSGIPLILSVSYASDGTNTVFSFNNHVNLGDNYTGNFLVKFPEVVTTSAQPVVFNTIGAGSPTPLYLNTGVQATVADLASTAAPTYHEFVYDRESNRLQLIA